MRFTINKVRGQELYPKRGLGIWFEYGSLGTIVGDPRRNMFLDVTMLVGWLTYEFHWSWKGTKNGL